MSSPFSKLRNASRHSLNVTGTCPAERQSSIGRTALLGTCLLLILLATGWPVLAQNDRPKAPPTQPAEKGDDEPTEKADQPDQTPESTPAKRDNDPDTKPVEAPADETEERPAGSPLGRLLGRLFLGPEEEPETSRGRDKKALRNDPRAPFNTKLTGLLKKAQSQLRSNEVRQCADTLQKLLDLPEDALWEASPGKLISVRTAAQRLLAKLPKEEQERYRLQVSGQAQRELQQAETTGDSAKLAQIATRYFQTEAGYLAADQLASKYLDRGEFGLAARWLEELWQAKAPCTKLPGWRMKAEYVAKQVPTTVLAKLLKSQTATLPDKATIAGQLVDCREWLAKQAGAASPTTPTLDDWPQFFGSARHVGQASAGEPLLLKRWSLPLTSNAAVQNIMDRLIEDLRDSYQTPILTFDPLLVDGKVIFRSLRGVKVADAQTGKLLWTTPDEPSAEDLLAAISAQANQDPFDNVVPNAAQPLRAIVDLLDLDPDQSPSDHPLTHLLFRNANHGLLSSDGSRLFVVEEQSVLSDLQPGRYSTEDLPEADSFGRPLGVNQLTAYDLKTGRSTWEIGGRNLNDPFALPLAGTFLFGPPVAEGGDLFLVNENDGEIRLQVLDPSTGIPRWSQLLAHAQSKISSDIGRQWFTSQVAVADGLIVCPTTVGWLVAVDRTTRNILWAHRYQDTRSDEPFEPQEDAVQPAELTERWTPAPPVIVGNRVVFTPPETRVIVCLNLSDGELLWRHSNDEESIYLAGVFGKQAILVGPQSLRAIDIENKGKTLWTVKYGSKDARPAGRGVAVQERYYLPLTTGELLCINLAVDTKSSERIAARLHLPASKNPEVRQFGNLAMYRGMLLSLGSQGVVAFEPKLSIEAELKRELAANPQSAAAVIRQAELELLQDRNRSALDMLHPLRDVKLTGELRQRYRDASVQALAALVREDLKSRDDEFAELAQWAELPAEKQARDMLQAERLLARQDFKGAFEVYVSFAQSFGQTLVHPSATTNYQVQADRWAGGRLEQLWRGRTEELGPVLDQKVQERAQAAIVGDLEAQNRFLTLFGFHPAAQIVRRRQVEALSQTESWQAAENVLWDLSLDPEQRPWAVERLARLWRQVGLPADAAQSYQRLERDHPAAQLDGGKTVAAILKELRDASQLPLVDTKPLINWRNRDLELSRSGSNFDVAGGARVFPLQGAGLPYFQRHRIQFSHQEARFEVVDVTTEKRNWSIPLRLNEDTVAEEVAANVHGHEVVLYGGGHVTALSPVERRVIWSQPLRGRPSRENTDYIGIEDYGSRGTQRYSAPLRNIVDRSGGPSRFIDPWPLFPQHGTAHFVSNQRYVAYLLRRQLTVLDAATGELAWERNDLPASAVILGGPCIIFVRDPMLGNITAYSALDGSKLEIPKLNSFWKTAIEVVDDDLIRIEPVSAFNFTTGIRLQRFNVLAQSEVWRTTLPKDVKATCISGHRLVLLGTDGQLQICDLKTGVLSPCGALPVKEIRNDTELRVIPTYEQLLVVACQNHRFPDDNHPESFPSMRVQGMVHAFELATGKEQWKQRVEGLHLILERLDDSPVVLFLARKMQRNQPSNWKLSVEAIDRQGGKIVLETTTSVQSNYHQLRLNGPDEFLELRSYNDRVRLSPKRD